MKQATKTPFTRHANIEVPIICGPMYPCSNPELVAAVSEAGGLGVVQPITLTFVNGYELRAGLRYIRQLTHKPIAMNALIEKSSRKYHQRMVAWIETALEEGVRFFITSLGKPDWVVDKVHQAGGVVYHDATERKWAVKGVDAGIDGLIAVNNKAGGHAGSKDAQQLYDELADLELPIVCAGGISTTKEMQSVIEMGYCGVQMGTRFIATHECTASLPYKQAIIAASEDDIVLTERITGIPVAVIRTPTVERVGLRCGWFVRRMLGNTHTKHLMRTLYALRSLWKLKKSLLDKTGRLDYWQAGKSVAGITGVLSVEDVVKQVREIGY